MSDEEVEVPVPSFKKRNIRNRGGRKRKESSSEEKNSSDSDQGVVLPIKKPLKANPNIQSTSGPKKQKVEILDEGSSGEETPKDRTTLSVQQQRENATATYELDTERDRDAQALFEKAQKINEELEGQADDKVYRGINNYAQYYKKKDTAAGNASSGLVRKGPIRAPANLRATVSDRTRWVSRRQLDLLCEFLHSHRDMATAFNRSLEAKDYSKKKWREIAEVLNSEGDGTHKTWSKWCKYWVDYKAKLKKRVSALRISQSANGEGLSTDQPLTDIERKFLQLLGEDFSQGLPDVRDEPFPESSSSTNTVEAVVPEAVLKREPRVVLSSDGEAELTAHSPILLGEHYLSSLTGFSPPAPSNAPFPPNAPFPSNVPFPSNAPFPPNAPSTPAPGPARAVRFGSPRRRRRKVQSMTQDAARRALVASARERAAAAVNSSRALESIDNTLQRIERFIYGVFARDGE